MPKYNLIYINPDQDLALETLLRTHNTAKTIISIEKFSDLIASIKSLLDNEDFSSLTQINRDGFLGSLRRIEWSFLEYQKVPTDYTGHDKREAFVSVFLHNAKCFLEISKKCFSKVANQNSLFKRTAKDITTLRDFFAHSYEKDFLGEKGNIFARLNINHDCNNQYKELFELEIFDIEDSRKIYGVFFSLEIFLMEIQIILRAINSMYTK